MFTHTKATHNSRVDATRSMRCARTHVRTLSHKRTYTNACKRAHKYWRGQASETNKRRILSYTHTYTRTHTRTTRQYVVRQHECGGGNRILLKPTPCAIQGTSGSAYQLARGLAEPSPGLSRASRQGDASNPQQRWSSFRRRHSLWPTKNITRAESIDTGLTDEISDSEACSAINDGCESRHLRGSKVRAPRPSGWAALELISATGDPPSA